MRNRRFIQTAVLCVCWLSACSGDKDKKPKVPDAGSDADTTDAANPSPGDGGDQTPDGGGDPARCTLRGTGCTCGSAIDCDRGLVCDTEKRTCRAAITSCASAGCSSHQACSAPAGGGDVACQMSCEPGYAWKSQAGMCEAQSGATCQAGTGSINAQCQSINRVCVSTGTGAECGACLSGTVPAGSACTAVTTCLDLNCTGTHRSCSEATGSRHAQCGSCLEGYVEQNGTCVAQASGSDCGSGEGIWKTGCVKCTGTPSCGSDGESGRVLSTYGAGSECICETTEGYFSTASLKTAPCDGDADGWVRESAQAYIDAVNIDDAVLTKNARCEVRTIHALVLENEHGSKRTISLSKALPLYESDPNDGGNLRTTQLGITLYNVPKQLSSLGKACVSANADLNDNGLNDVSESSASGSSVKSTRGWSSALLGYYQEYTKHSFFLEQHEAYFVPDAEGSTRGTYMIRERSRKSGSWPTYPSDAGPYNQACYRKPDRLYGSSGVTSYAGGDFVQYGGSTAGDWSGWPGMGHHSQFKCVQYAATEQAYGANTRNSAPQLVYGTDGAVQRKVPGSSPETLAWWLSTCTPTAPTASSGDGKNPLKANFTCASSNPETGKVYWAAAAYQDYDESNQYTRGCIDECVDKRPGAAACPQCVTMAGVLSGQAVVGGDFGRANCPVLIEHTIDSLGPTSSGNVPSLGQIRILEQTLLLGDPARVCSTSVCVTGGLSP